MKLKIGKNIKELLDPFLEKIEGKREFLTMDNNGMTELFDSIIRNQL
jgi:hypothetical protein